VRRNDRDDAKSNEMSRVQWRGLKAFAINTAGQFIYGNVTLLGLKMKASNALGNTSDRISVKAIRRLPTVQSGFASIEATTNVADAFAAIVRQADVNGIDLPKLQTLAGQWANTNGFNYRFVDATTVYDALQTVASNHRSKPEAYARKLSMRPDRAIAFDQYLVSHENMIKDSYSCGIKLTDDGSIIDGVRLAYADPNSVRELYVTFPANSSSPEAISFIGCTDAATALAQAKYLWAKRVAARRVVEFRTEWQGNAFSVGDRIAVLQNLVDTVRTARVMEVNGNDLVIDAVLDAPSIIVRLTDEFGNASIPLPASMAGNIITLASAPPFAIHGINSGQDPTPVVIGAMESFKHSYQITSITPDDDGVSVSAISYTDAPYLYPIPGEVI
jgi:hypothetical protein